MKTYKIGSIPGDGIGPEVQREGLKVLAAVSEIAGFRYQLVEYPYSGTHYLATKELVPDRVIDEWRTLDAVLLGAIGHPDVESEGQASGAHRFRGRAREHRGVRP